MAAKAPLLDKNSMLSDWVQANSPSGLASRYAEPVENISVGDMLIDDTNVNIDSDDIDTTKNDVTKNVSNYDELSDKYGTQLDNAFNLGMAFPYANLLSLPNYISGHFGGPTYGKTITGLYDLLGKPGHKLHDWFGGFDSYDEMNEYYKNQELNPIKDTVKREAGGGSSSTGKAY